MKLQVSETLICQGLNTLGAGRNNLKQPLEILMTIVSLTWVFCDDIKEGHENIN